MDLASANVPFFGVIRSIKFLKHGAQSSREKLHSKIPDRNGLRSPALQTLHALETVSFCERYRTDASLAEENELVFMDLRGADACFLRSQNAKKIVILRSRILLESPSAEKGM